MVLQGTIKTNQNIQTFPAFPSHNEALELGRKGMSYERRDNII